MIFAAVFAAAALAASPCPTADPREPNAEHQRPAFEGQTRACTPAQKSNFRVTTFARGLDLPWGIAVLPDGRLLVSERRVNDLRVVMPDGRVLPPIGNFPAVDYERQGGLLDVAVQPRGANEFLVCVSLAEKREGGLSGTSVGCATAKGAENLTLENFRIVFRQQPGWKSPEHYGSRLVFAPDGSLFVTLGERERPASRVHAQDLTTTLGKVVRIRTDGSSPSDNPFATRGGVAAQIYTLGHRNVQAAAWRAETNSLWTVEHGPAGGDELNQEIPGRNYGWPIITYGVDYDGRPIGAGITARAGLEQPVYYWDPVIAPSALLFYSGRMFPEWRGDAIIGGLQSQGLVRLVMRGDRVVNEERLPLGERIRDVVEARDGSLYVSVDSASGSILRISRP